MNDYSGIMNNCLANNMSDNYRRPMRDIVMEIIGPKPHSKEWTESNDDSSLNLNYNETDNTH